MDNAVNLYVADYQTIRMITPSRMVTTLAGRAGSSGTTDGIGSDARFGDAFGVAMANDGNLYVVDSANSTVRQITPVGADWVVATLAGRAGQTGSADGDALLVARFNHPLGVAVDSAGNLYVADRDNHTTRKLTHVGTDWVVTTLAGSPGVLGFTEGTGSAARFAHPFGVAVDSAGNVYVAEIGAARIRKGMPPPPTLALTCASNKTVTCGTAWNFDPPTVSPNACADPNVTVTEQSTVTNGVCPQLLTRTWQATDPCGNTNTCRQTVTVVNTTPPIFTNCPPATLDLGCNPATIPDCDPNVRAINGCASASSPVYLLVSSTGSGQVKRYNAATGAFIDDFASGGGLVSPLGLAFGPDHNLYVSSGSSYEVKRYNGATGTFIDTFVPSASGDLTGPHGLEFGPAGNLYVSSQVTHQVKRYNGLTGAFIDTFASGGGLSSPTGLTFGPDDNLRVSSYNNGVVERYNGTTGSFMDNFDVIYGPGAGLDHPLGLTFGPDGNIYVSVYNYGRVNRYSASSGAIIDIFASGSGLDHPAGVTFGPDGNIYVSSSYTHQVKRYNGTSGAFIDNFVTAGSGGLNGPSYLMFPQPGPVVTCAKLDSTNGCARPRTLTSTVTDACGNSTNCQQVITWTEDRTAPVITPSGTTLTLGCNPTTAAIQAALGGATATDNCGSLTPTPSDSAVTSNGCGRSQTRTWTFTNTGGTVATPVSRTVTWTEDTTRPSITGCASSATVQTFSQVPPPDPGAVVATDDCPGDLTINLVSDSSVTNACTVTITRRYRVSDACGNFRDCFQTIIVQLVSPPPNDACANAIALTAGASVCGTNVCATRSFSLPPLCGNSANSPDVWYTFTPQCNGPVTLDTCDGCSGQVRTFDTVLSVYTGGCSSLVQVPNGCNDDAGGNCGQQSRVTFHGTAGDTYRIRVAGRSGASGTFRIRVSATGSPPVNDDLASPTLVTIGSPAARGSTVCATPSAPRTIPTPCNGLANSPDVWFKSTPECSGPVTITTCGSGQTVLETVLSVYNGAPGRLSQLDCNRGGCGRQSVVRFNGNAGVPYHIRVAGMGGKAGDFQLNIASAAAVPANDLCDSAQPIGLGTVPFNTTCGANTDGPSQPGCQPDHDVWFRYDASCSGQVVVDTCRSSVNTIVSVYSGSCGNLIPLPCNDDAADGQCAGSQQSRVTFPVTLGTRYLIRVGGAGQATGWGRLTLSDPSEQAGVCPPANGPCFDRYFLVLGPPNNTPWAWSIRAFCCANVENLNLPGVPSSGTPETLAEAFAASINEACPNGGVTATALHVPNFPGAFKVCVRSCTASPLRFDFRVGPAGTPAQNQCDVADFYG